MFTPRPKPTSWFVAGNGTFQGSDLASSHLLHFIIVQQNRSATMHLSREEQCCEVQNLDLGI